MDLRNGFRGAKRHLEQRIQYERNSGPFVVLREDDIAISLPRPTVQYSLDFLKGVPAPDFTELPTPDAYDQLTDKQRRFSIDRGRFGFGREREVRRAFVDEEAPGGLGYSAAYPKDLLALRVRAKL